MSRPTWQETAVKAIHFAGTLQERIRQKGYVDVMSLIGNPMLRGALAELEMQGAIEFTAPPPPDWKIPCRVVPEQERAAARERRAACEIREWETMRLPSRRSKP